jgi:hypothetical protein
MCDFTNTSELIYIYGMNRISPVYPTLYRDIVSDPQVAELIKQLTELGPVYIVTHVWYAKTWANIRHDTDAQFDVRIFDRYIWVAWTQPRVFLKRENIPFAVSLAKVSDDVSAYS